MVNVIPKWTVDKLGQVVVRRDAEFWHRSGMNVICDLCYKACELRHGQTGPCGARKNLFGMQLQTHGVISCACRVMNGYQSDPFMLFRPGAKSLALGGVHCTSRCSFCLSRDASSKPDRLRWPYGFRQMGQTGGWCGNLAMLHPLGAISLAREWGCAGITFGSNEPLLTWEYTFDAARLAKEAGLFVCILTNGFSSLAAIRKLAPYVDAVDVGIKGSLSPSFYDRFMQAGDAIPTVKASLEEWRAAGVHLLVGDVISPPHMASEQEAEEAQKAFSAWVAEELGELTPVIIGHMITPGEEDKYLLRAGASDDDVLAYLARIERAVEIAQDAGLAYVHQKRRDETIRCHSCGGVLLRFHFPQRDCNPCQMATSYCPWASHEQYVTDGKCNHCGAEVPIVVEKSPA